MNDAHGFSERNLLEGADKEADAAAVPGIPAQPSVRPPGHTCTAAHAPPRGRTDYVPVAEGEPLWVFGYGSLMWNPGFPYETSEPALLQGYHRRFCVYSFHYRGTPEQPGLVLGLDRGGSCRGIAFRVAPADVRKTLAYLWDREMISYVYRPAWLPIRLAAGRVQACTFVADRAHEQYCRLTGLEAMAGVICKGHGRNGPNCEYLFNTVRHLDELGIRETPLHRLADMVRVAL